jgi:fumarate reductase subunit C
MGWEMKSGSTFTGYTVNHPRWYRKRVSTYWWLQRWEYLRFVLREISSVFVAFFVVSTLAQLAALARGPQAYAEFQDVLRNPFVVALNGISFLFVVFHTVTWFSLAARAMVVRVGGKRVPEFLISGGHFAGWLVVSGIVAWFLLGG